MLSCTFLCCPCMNTTWKCLISCFMEDGNTRWQFPFSSTEQSFRIQLHKNGPLFAELNEMEYVRSSLKQSEFTFEVTFLWWLLLLLRKLPTITKSGGVPHPPSPPSILLGKVRGTAISIFLPCYCVGTHQHPYSREIWLQMIQPAKQLTEVMIYIM